MGGLRGREVSLDPNSVAGGQVGDLRGRQRLRASGDFDVKDRPGEVKRRGGGMGRCSQNYC